MFFAAIGSSFAAFAQGYDYYDSSVVTPVYSSFGFGVELSQPVDIGVEYHTQMRIGFTDGNSPFELNVDVDGTEYKTDFKSQHVKFLVDVYPVEDSDFYVSGGVLYNEGHIRGETNPGQSVTLNGTTYETIEANVKHKVSAQYSFPTFSPYIGVGYGKKVKKGKTGWDVTADIGLIYVGEPDVDMKATYLQNGSNTLYTQVTDESGVTTVAINQEVAADMDAAEKDLEDEFKSLAILPYVSVGAAYHF